MLRRKGRPYAISEYNQFAFVGVHLLGIKGLLRLIAISVITIFLIPNSALLHKK